MKKTYFVILLGLSAILFGVATFQRHEIETKNVFVVNSNQKHLTAYLIFPLNSKSQQAHKSDNSAGLAHYLEHLVWASLKAGKPDKASAAWHSNAWTNHYTIGYHLSGPKSQLPIILQRLSGAFKTLTISADFAQQERGIILREYDNRLGNHIDARASQVLNTFLYQDTPLAVSLLGNTEQIKQLDLAKALALHSKTHQKKEAILLVIGDVTKRDVANALIDSNFPKLGADTGSDTDRDKETLLPFRMSQPDFTEFHYSASSVAPRVIWRRLIKLDEPIAFDLLEAELKLLQNILTSSLPGGLAGPLHYEAKLASSFSIALYPLDDRHITMEFAARADDQVSLKQLHKAFESTLETIAKQTIPSRTYDRIFKRFDTFWPDWQNEEKANQWLVQYTLRRLSHARQPLALSDLRSLKSQLSHDQLNRLLTYLISPQSRTAIAYIGK